MVVIGPATVIRGAQHLTVPRLDLRPHRIVGVYGRTDAEYEAFLYYLMNATNLFRPKKNTLNELSWSSYAKSSVQIEYEESRVNGSLYSSAAGEAPAQKYDIGVVFNDPELFTIGRFVSEEYRYAIESRNARHPIEKLRVEVTRLDRYGLAGKLERRTKFLSGGEKFRLTWGCLLETKPSVIVADLRHSNLDSDFLPAVRSWIGAQLDPYVLLLGGLESEVFAPDAYLFVSNGTVCLSADAPEWLTPVSQQAKLLPSELRERKTTRAIVNVKDFHLKGTEGVYEESVTNPYSLEIGDREIVCLYGPNGSGKTSLARALCGLLEKAQIGGSIEPKDSGKVTMALQYPTRSLFGYTVGEELDDPDLIQFIGLTGGQFSRNLPASKQKLLCCAKALSSAERLCVLDEPTSGMSFEDKRTLLQLINRFPDMSVLICTHDAALRNIGRVVVLGK